MLSKGWNKFWAQIHDLYDLGRSSKMILQTKYTSSKPCGFRHEDFRVFYFYCHENQTSAWKSLVLHNCERGLFKYYTCEVSLKLALQYRMEMSYEVKLWTTDSGRQTTEHYSVRWVNLILNTIIRNILFQSVMFMYRQYTIFS